LICLDCRDHGKDIAHGCADIEMQENSSISFVKSMASPDKIPKVK